MSAQVTTSGWTNSSVLALTAGRDPLEVAREIADALLRRARELGLAGPPVDVLGLARASNITLRPANEIGDAKIEADSDHGGDLVISYNPSRPRGRLRFNIAHELAHAQFPDVMEQVRLRTPLGAAPSTSSDTWELELMCNIIASDLLMPSEGMEGIANSATDIDYLIECRRRWDVSTEALLRRYVSLASRGISLLASGRISDSKVRIDYVDSSPLVQDDDPIRSLVHGELLEGADSIGRTVAVGQTERGRIAMAGRIFLTQSVGSPPYPGSRGARILTLIEPDLEPTNPRIEHVRSDLTDTDDPTVMFVHVGSDAVRGWSRMGVGARLASRYPGLATSYRMWTLSDPSHLQLGRVHLVEQLDKGQQVAVATVVAQEGYGASGRMRYDSLAGGLEHVRRAAQQSRAVVHLPRLGSGRAGGRWDLIENLLDEHLAAHGIRVVVHTKPSGSTR